MEPTSGHRQGHAQVLHCQDAFAHGNLNFGSPVPRRRAGSSPSMLMANTNRNKATPGIEISHRSKNVRPLASEIIKPHDGVGGCTPSPRKDNAASSRMAGAISWVATTIRW